MANALYANGKSALATAGVNWTSDTIKAALVTSSYTPNLSSDQYYSTLSANVVGTPQTLSSKSATGGVCNCADITFSSVSSGSTVAYIAIYKDTGTGSTSPLIALFDTGSGLPYTTNGGNITISFGSNHVFSL